MKSFLLICLLILGSHSMAGQQQALFPKIKHNDEDLVLLKPAVAQRIHAIRFNKSVKESDKPQKIKDILAKETQCAPNVRCITYCMAATRVYSPNAQGNQTNKLIKNCNKALITRDLVDAIMDADYASSYNFNIQISAMIKLLIGIQGF